MGGSAQEWHTDIDEGLVPASSIELHLVMTKFGGEAVTIGYEVVLRTG